MTFPMTGAQPGQQLDPFAPTPTGGGKNPGMRHLVGRTVIMRPTRVDETTKGLNSNELRPTLYADLLVCDGGDVVYGDDASKGTPPTHRSQTPALFRDVAISNKVIVDGGRSMLMAGQPVTVGVVEKGTFSKPGQSPAFILTETSENVDKSPRQDGAQRRQLAIGLWNAHTAGQWHSPAPVELTTGSAPAQVAQPAAWGGPTAAPAPQFAAPQGWPQQPPAPAAPQAPVVDLSRPVPGLESVWGQATEQQRQQAWTAHLMQQGQATAPANPWGQPQTAPSPAAPAATPWG